ncbi:MAG TPA: type III secretion system outer membrane ring subunit SctC [Rhodanobacter sp.]|nr:type III secretion system outer membrane ring subunit SctC [Rhodanobacter sp.]
MRRNRDTLERRNQWLACAGALVVLLFSTAVVEASSIPFKRGTTEIQSDKTLHEILPDFFHDQGLEVVLSSQVAARSGTINGNFKGTYAQVWRRIADSNNLLAYWDGSAVYVYLDSERQTDYSTIPLPVEQQFLAAMASVNWADTATGNIWKLEPSTGLVTITGTKRFAEQVKQMAQTISGLGQNPTSRFKFYPLKYAWASDTTMTIGNRQVTIPGVASVLRELVGESGSDGQFSGAHERMISARQRGLRGQGLAASGGQPPPPLGDYSSQAQADDDGLSPPNAQLVPAAQQGALQVTSGAGGSRIVADSFRNAIIVRDTADRLPMYDELIRQLDVAPQMVEIEATIIDVDKSKARKLGVNWFYRNGRNTVGFSGTSDSASLSTKATLLAALGLGNTGALPSLFNNGFQIGAILGDPAKFIFNVNALEDDGVTHVVTHPQVITMDDAEAVIQSNQTVYIPVQGAYNSDLYNVVAGTTLRVTPHVVMENGLPRIRLMVQIEDGNISYSAKDANKVQYPIVSQNAVNTQAVIADGQGLLLGGLIQDQGQNMEHKIPLLGDIPVLGYLFKTVQKERDHTERLFLITPRLVALNHITGQQTPSSSQVTIDTQQQIDKQQQQQESPWNYRGRTVIQQPLPSPSPVPPQPVMVQPLQKPSRH